MCLKCRKPTKNGNRMHWQIQGSDYRSRESEIQIEKEETRQQQPYTQNEMQCTMAETHYLRLYYTHTYIFY